MTSAALKTTTQLVGRNEVTNDEGKVVEFQEVRTYPGNMVLTVLATLGFIDSWGVTLPPNAPDGNLAVLTFADPFKPYEL